MPDRNAHDAKSDDARLQCAMEVGVCPAPADPPATAATHSLQIALSVVCPISVCEPRGKFTFPNTLVLPRVGCTTQDDDDGKCHGSFSEHEQVAHERFDLKRRVRKWMECLPHKQDSLTRVAYEGPLQSCPSRTWYEGQGRYVFSSVLYGYLPHSFQGSFFLEILRKPRENSWFLKRTMGNQPLKARVVFFQGLAVPNLLFISRLKGEEKPEKKEEKKPMPVEPVEFLDPDVRRLASSSPQTRGGR